MRSSTHLSLCSNPLVCAVVIFLIVAAPILPPAAAADVLSLAVKPFGTGAQVVLSASQPLRFSLRHLSGPPRLIVDLAGLEVGQLAGAQEINLPPVRTVRLTRSNGGVQVVVELMEPVLVDITTSTDARTLTLLLRPMAMPAARTTPSSPLPTEVLRLQYLKARDVAAHLQVLLPGLGARPDETTNSVIVTGSAEQIAQARQLVGALDAPPASAPVTEVIPLKVLKAGVVAPIVATIFPQAQIRAEDRINALVVIAPPVLLARVKIVIAALDVPPAALPSAPTTEVLRVQHADPAQAASLLASVLPEAQVRVDPATRTLTVTAPPAVLAQAKTLLQQMDVPSPSAQISEIVRVRTGDPEAVAAALRQAVPAVTVTADRALGALILQGPRADVERAKTILTTLDGQPPPLDSDARRGDPTEVHDAERVRHRAVHQPVRRGTGADPALGPPARLS
jgi:hypothetical protein